jgi:hypothetical protein
MGFSHILMPADSAAPWVEASAMQTCVVLPFARWGGEAPLTSTGQYSQYNTVNGVSNYNYLSGANTSMQVTAAPKIHTLTPRMQVGCARRHRMCP